MEDIYRRSCGVVCSVCDGHKVVLCKATRWPVIWEESGMMSGREAITPCPLYRSYSQEKGTLKTVLV